MLANCMSGNVHVFFVPSSLVSTYYTGTLLSSSVVPFIIAVSNTDAARGQILLSPVRCNLFSGTQQDVAEELSSLLTEDDDFVLVLDSTPGEGCLLNARYYAPDYTI